MRIIRNFALFFMVICFEAVHAQTSAEGGIEMADRLKADGKIYVVVGVVAIILIGLLIYLARIDSKVTKLEKEIEADKNGK
jgi:hypothetical protein